MASAFRKFGAKLLADGFLARGLSSGFGYKSGVGVGSTVTQLTNRTTGVTINALSGTITTDSTSLAAEGTAEFTVTNSKVAATDVVVVAQKSGAVAAGTIVFVSAVAAGSFKIKVHNGNVAAGTAETGAILINFAVIKSTAN